MSKIARRLNLDQISLQRLPCETSHNRNEKYDNSAANHLTKRFPGDWHATVDVREAVWIPRSHDSLLVGGIRTEFQCTTVRESLERCSTAVARFEQTQRRTGGSTRFHCRNEPVACTALLSPSALEMSYPLLDLIFLLQACPARLSFLLHHGCCWCLNVPPLLLSAPSLLSFKQ